MELQFIKDYLSLILPILLFSGILVSDPRLLELSIIGIIITIMILVAVFKAVWNWLDERGLSDFVLAGFVGIYLALSMYLLSFVDILKMLGGLFYFGVALFIMQYYFANLRVEFNEKNRHRTS